MQIRVGYAIAIMAGLAVVGGLVVGHYGFSRHTKEPASEAPAAVTLGSDRLPAEQDSAVAQADRRAAEAKVRNAIPSIEAYYVDHGSYLGVTVDGLRATYDPGLDRALVIPLRSVTAQSYCVQLAGVGSTFHTAGPSGDVATGPCP